MNIETNQDVLDTERGFFENERIEAINKIKSNQDHLLGFPIANDNKPSSSSQQQTKILFYKVPKKHENQLDLPILGYEGKYRT